MRDGLSLRNAFIAHGVRLLQKKTPERLSRSGFFFERHRIYLPRKSTTRLALPWLRSTPPSALSSMSTLEPI